MTNYTELKRLAEDCKNCGIDFDDVSPQQGSTSCNKLVRHYLAAASPDVVLSMIAEIDRLRTQNQALREALKRAKPFVEGREYECEAQYDTSKDGAHYDAFATARDIREQCDVALAQAEGGV